MSECQDVTRDTALLDDGQQVWDSIMNSDSLNQGIGTAIGAYYGGPTGAAIGAIVADPVWDATVGLSEGINNTLNLVTGTNTFPLLGNFGATYSDGTPIAGSEVPTTIPPPPPTTIPPPPPLANPYSSCPVCPVCPTIQQPPRIFCRPKPRTCNACSR
jgi:hypothetical protein